MLAHVKCARLVVVDQVLLHLVTVLLRRRERWLGWSGEVSWRLGQSQLTARPPPPLMGAWSSSKVAAVSVWGLATSPIIGKFSVIMPRAMQASLLINSLSELSVT